MNIEGLGSREGLEEAVEKVQSSCLAGMFQVSMDRQRYAAVGAQDMDKGEEVALEEIRALEEETPVSAAFSFLTVTIPHSIFQCDCHYHEYMYAVCTAIHRNLYFLCLESEVLSLYKCSMQATVCAARCSQLRYHAACHQMPMLCIFVRNKTYRRK